MKCLLAFQQCDPVAVAVGLCMLTGQGQCGPASAWNKVHRLAAAMVAGLQVTRDAADPAPSGTFTLAVTRTADSSEARSPDNIVLRASGSSSRSVRFTEAAELLLTITLDGTEIAGSGQTVVVQPAAVHRPSTQFALQATEIVAGQELIVTSQARDEFGNDLEAGGSLFLCVSA